MATVLTNRFTQPSYQAVPIESEASESQSLPQQGDSPPAVPSDPRAWRVSPDNAGLHDRKPLRLAVAELPAGHQTSLSESQGVGSAISTELQRGSSRRQDRKERWWEWKKTARRWWLYELFGAIISVACFTALVVVLRRSNGKEPTRWLYNRLTLNGLIALLSTFIRATMMFGVGASLSQMKWNQYYSRGSCDTHGQRLGNLDTFDQASRGPFGSFMLIVARTRPHLGLIGALITIFTLAFDAFAQEVVIIRYKNYPGVNGASVGLVPRSETYNQWTKITQESNFANDLNTVAAEYNGIFNYHNITSPVPQCSTGNCTWPIVPSLAVCGSCTDVTTSMSYTCVGTSEADPTVATNDANCTYTLSEGRRSYSEAPGYTFWTTPTGSNGDGVPVLAYAVVSGYVIPQYNQSKFLYIDNWLMVNASIGSVTASACALWFCVQAYETSVENGVPKQTIVGNWSETDTLVAGVDEGWINFTNIPKNMGPATDYSVNGGVLIAFEQNAIFYDANVSYGLDSTDFYAYSSDTVRSLHTIADYTDWIDKFALGLSNNVRSTGASSTPASAYIGTALTSVPYVHVRWPWLAFPAAMVVSSLLFLAACIWQTSYLHVEPWKGDALALLLASIDEDLLRESASRWQIEEKKVWLQPSGGSAVFRKLVVEKQTQSQWL